MTHKPVVLEAENVNNNGVGTSDRSEMISKLKEPFPQAAIKQREGANKKMLDYVSGETVLRRAMRATNDNFNITFAFPPYMMTIKEMYTNRANNKRESLEVDVFVVGVEVEIPGLGKRAGIGVQKNQGGGEDLLKGALTDAIKNGFKNHGVALDLYGEDIEGKNEPNF